MIVDLSFIPDELISDELKSVSASKIEYPYSSTQLFRNYTEKDDTVSKRNSLFIKNRARFRENYRKFEAILFEFARDLYRKKNFGLSASCFRYLVEAGSRHVASKEYLLKIYIKQKNIEGIKWVKKRLENQLKENSTIPNDIRKLRRILGKYFPLR